MDFVILVVQFVVEAGPRGRAQLAGDDDNNSGGRPLGEQEQDSLAGTCGSRPDLPPALLRGAAPPGDDMATDGLNEVVDNVAGHLAVGTLSSYNLQPQGGDHVSIDMPPHHQVPAGQSPAPVELIRAIWSISLLTLVPAISTALYKPARGVLFSHNKLSYYLALSVIFASGIGEAFTAFWLSRPNGGSRRRLTFGRAVLCASILPFAAVLGIAGYGFIQG